MIISITGNPGSGKSTIAKKIAKKLNYKHYYIGKLRRETAKSQGMTLTQYNKLGETDSVTDFEVDKMQKKLGQKKENFVIEGRTSWHFIPHSLKLFLAVNPDEGAKRVFEELKRTDHRNEDKKMNSVQEVFKSHGIREKSDKIRYKKYYNIDCNNKNNFDFVLDTTNLTPQQVFKKTIDFIKTKLDN